MADIYRRPLRAAIYCRISLAQYGDTVKVKRQEKLCRKLAKRLGWEVIHVYCDNNKSAWKRNRSRPDWDAMLEAVERGEINSIIFYHGDRLIRQPWDLELLLNLADGRGIRLASPTGTRNLDDADDRYRLRQDVAKACNESDTISRRTRVVHKERAEKGKIRKGGNRAFGYTRAGKIVEAEAAEYRDAVARILAGESKRSIVRDWRTRELLTTRGNPWTVGTLSIVLRNPRYAGLSVYKGDIVGVGKWKPLVDRETWEALQAACGAIAEQYTQTPKDRTSKYLLTYIATHDGCGGKMRMHHNGRGQALSYACGSVDCTEKVTRNMANVDAYVVGNVLRRLSDDELWERVDAAPSDEGAGEELKALEQRLTNTIAQFAEADPLSPTALSPAALEGIVRRLEERIAAVRTRIAARKTVHVLDGCRNMTPEQWAELPMDRRRAIVRATVTVQIRRSAKGRVFDPSSVLVESVNIVPV